MSKGIYTGVEGMARKVQKLYVGVDGSARKAVKGYVGDAEGKARLFYDDGAVSVTFQKHWEDYNNWDGLRGDTIDIQLTQNGEDYGYPVRVMLRDGWTYTWENLPKYAADRQDIPAEYDIREESLHKDYTPSHKITQQGNHITIDVTNTHERYEITLTAKVVWEDEENSSGARPGSVHVVPYMDGSPQSSMRLGPQYLSETNGWMYVWTGLIRLKNMMGHAPVKYDVKEDVVPEGYTVSYDTQTDENGNITVTITNTLTA